MDRSPPVDFEALLAQANWVKQLAAHLVRDPDQAEDLVQETWRKAFERPPDHGMAERGLRAWLARVMRNLAIDRGRDSRLRSWHERKASRPEAWTAEEIGERVALQRWLAESVFGLEEPYRSAITLRYFEGLSPREIAGRQRITYDSARQRISRGLAMLRARLDHEHGDDRAAWCSLLVGLIRKSAKPHPLLPFLEGGLLMSVNAKLLGGIAAALVVTSLLVWRSIRTETPRVSGSASAVPTASALSPSPSGAEHPALSDARSPLAEKQDPKASVVDRDHDLHGSVIDPAGKPVEGARVEVVRDESNGYPRETEEVPDRHAIAQTVTDGRGEFAVNLPIGRPFDLSVTADGFAPARLGYRYAGEEVTIQLGAGATLFGRATRADDGKPVEAALLEVSTWVGTIGYEKIILQRSETDSDGRFRFVNLPATSIVLKITPMADGAQVRRSIDLVSGSEREENLVVEAGPSIRGRVLDAATKEPIANAEVGEVMWVRRSVRSDAGGEYVYRGIRKTGPVALQARAKGYGPQTHIFRSSSNVDDLPDHYDLLLSPGRRVRGRVVDREGQAIPGAYVAAVANRRITPPIPETDRVAGRTDEKGGFELSDLRGDVPHSLIARKDGFGTVAYEFPATEPKDTLVDLGDVVLPPMSVVRGSILDEAGHAVPDWEVALRGSNADRGRFRAERDERDADVDRQVATRTARTDDLGRFAFADLAQGEYSLEVGRPNASTKTSQAVSVGSGTVVENVRIVLQALGTIAGTVTDSHGNGLIQAGVIANGEGLGIRPQSSALTDAAGHFSLEGLPPGNYRLRVTADNVRIAGGSDERHAFLKRELNAVSGSDKDMKVVLEAASVLRGRVVDADGHGLEWAAVMVRVPGRDDQISTFTGADGRFTVSIPEGTSVDLEVHAPLAEGTPQGRKWDPDPAHAGHLSAVSAGAEEVVIKLPR